MAGILAVIWGDREQVYFCGGDWTGQIGLKLLRKIAFWRAGNSRLVTPPSPLSTPQMSHRPHCALFHASPSCGFRPGLEEFEGGSCDDDYWANSITHSHHRSAVRFAVVDGEEEPNKAEQQVRVLDFSYPPSVRSPTIESLDEAEEEQLRTECKYADAPNDEQRYELSNRDLFLFEQEMEHRQDYNDGKHHHGDVEYLSVAAAVCKVPKEVKEICNERDDNDVEVREHSHIFDPPVSA